MSRARFIFQASEKIGAICAVMHRAGRLPKADMRALADAASISYSTLKTSVQKSRLSSRIEDALATFCRFDRDHPSWVDEAVPEAVRRGNAGAGYPGRDTLEQFRKRLNSIWGGSVSINFRANRRSSSALDPHMARHELSDLGQATASDSEMQLFLTAHFEPFHHRSGLMFGFRKAAITLDIAGEEGGKATQRLGHPDGVTLGDAILQGEGMSHQLRWSLDRSDSDADILSGEYATCEEPLVKVADYGDGTALTSRLEVNIYDRTTCSAVGEPDIAANKQALIEQIFSSELPDAEARHGWIVLSRHELVIARYGQ